MLQLAKNKLNYLREPAVIKAAIKRDSLGLPESDPGIDSAINAMTDWLCKAQDNSASADGGVARDYNLVKGWATSYPETTGYIIPTMLNLSVMLERPELKQRAERMLDWCEKIQQEDGGFQGGRIDSTPVVSVTFNTGQILLGLAAGVKCFDRYQDSMHQAARFLRDSMDDDGCWRRHPTPFAMPGEKSYETHVSWGLFEAERITPGEGYGEAGLKQVRWALTNQQSNGWVADCCLSEPEQPLTHTLGYFLKGVVEAHRLTGNDQFLDSALKTANGLYQAQRANGSLPGRLKSDWSPAVTWSCLTGNVQIADCWFYIGAVTGNDRLIEAAQSANRFVRRTIAIEGTDGERGGVKGSFPIDGSYGQYEYLNWAAKFAIDANISEKSLKTV